MNSSVTDLNRLLIENADGPAEPLTDHGWVSPDVSVSVFFKDLAYHLVALIDQADYVVGCVAWLTHPDILAALARKKGVSIVVQKEDWLRPDCGDWRTEDLRRRYAAVRRGLSRCDASLRGTTLYQMSSGIDDTVPPIRCVGNHNSARHPAAPRMHHKFLVFGRDAVPGTLQDPLFVPYAVWTGSFNLTCNATLSFENAVVLTHPAAVRAYFCEWGQVAALSEPLDWTSEWVAPEWRVGT